MDVDYPPVGTHVVITDGSEAHGDKGVVYAIENKLCLVELDQGCVWVVSEPWEIKRVKE